MRHRFSAVVPALVVVATMTMACDSVSDPVARAATVEIVSGNDQFTLSQDPLPDPLVVRVLDASGNPVKNAPVVWTTTSGYLQVEQDRTDADGLSSGVWIMTPPGTAVESWGEKTASARVGELTPATFTGRLLHGPILVSGSFTPESANLNDGPVVVNVTAEIATMYLGIRRAQLRIHRQSVVESFTADLTLVSGDSMSGTWTGSVEIPESANAGTWLIEIYAPTVSESCSCDGYPRAWLTMVDTPLVLTRE